MIPVSKGPKPPILEANEAGWTVEYMAARAAGPVQDTIRYRYRHQEIKGALHAEAHSKCVYCETKVAVGETDHINPVTECPEQIVAWVNLCLACKECNTNKGAYYSAAEPLINPFTEDPSMHLLFFGPLVLGKAGDGKGFRTVARIKLSRTELLQRRVQRVERLQPLANQWLAQPDGPTKELLRLALLAECADSAEYAAVVRAYLSQELGWVFPPPDNAAPHHAERAA